MSYDQRNPPPNALAIQPNDLVVFVDETGHENLSESDAVFGVGGIIVHGATYSKVVEEPWLRTRSKIGFAPDEPLHASTDFDRYKNHLDLLAEFFRQGAFIRHVSIVDDATKSTFDPFITATCAGFFRNVCRALVHATQFVQIDRVVYIVEHSERLHSSYAKLVGETGPTLLASNGSKTTFPHLWGAIRKSSCAPGLEVADFVMHAAQGQVKARRRNASAQMRRDFQAVFRSVPDHFVEYMEINEANSTTNDGPPGTFRIGL